MEEEEFSYVTLDRGGDEKPRINGVFYYYKNGSPTWGAIPFIKANCRIIEEQAEGRT